MELLKWGSENMYTYVYVVIKPSFFFMVCILYKGTLALNKHVSWIDVVCDLPTSVNVGVDALKYSLSQAYSFVIDICPNLSSITVLSSLVTSVQTYPVVLKITRRIWNIYLIKMKSGLKFELIGWCLFPIVAASIIVARGLFWP